MTQRTGRPKGHMARCNDCGTSGRLWLYPCPDLETSMHHGEDMQYCTDGQTHAWHTSPQEGAHPGDWSGIGRLARSAVHKKNNIKHACLVEARRRFTQANWTPFLQGPLLKDFREIAFKAVLAGTYVPPPGYA